MERTADEAIGRVWGVRDHPYVQGTICAKVARYRERVHHPGRLTTPLVRTGAKGEGAFAAIDWDEALDRVADGLRDAAARHGPEAVFPYRYGGTMGLVQHGALDRLRHELGWSRQKNTICSAILRAGWTAGVGEQRGLAPTDMAHADLIVVWGANPAATQVQLMRHITRARKQRGARLVVIDPWDTATARAADEHIAPRPGTDGALACAVLHVLFAEGHADRAYLARYTDHPPDLEAHLAERPPEWAAGITGVPADTIRAFARAWGATGRAFLRIGYGLTRQRNGAANVHAISALPAVTGAWQYPGGGALSGLSDTFAPHLDKRFLLGLDEVTPATRVLDMCRLGTVLAGDADALDGGPPVAALVVQNANPAVTAPASLRVRDGLRRDDLFTVVHEQFLTETAAFADVVLPATTFLEHDDLYQSYGHSFLQAGPAVIDPVGGAAGNHAVVSALAARLGADHPAFAMDAAAVADRLLADSGLPGYAALAADHWLDLTPDAASRHFRDGFPNKTGVFRFAADWAAAGADTAGLPRLPDHAPRIEAADESRPFRLVTPPARPFLNTTFTETASARSAMRRPTAHLHPDDLAALGLAEGDRVRLGNERATVVVHAAAADGPARGVVAVESPWPAADFAEGAGINALVGSDPVPPAGGAAFHDTAVWIEGV